MSAAFRAAIAEASPAVRSLIEELSATAPEPVAIGVDVSSAEGITGVELWFSARAADASLVSFVSILMEQGSAALQLRFVELLKTGGSALCKIHHVPAGRAGEPEDAHDVVGGSDAYFELVSALAAHCDDVRLFVRHGWPILSVGDSQLSTVAEGGAGPSCAPGGPRP